MFITRLCVNEKRSISTRLKTIATLLLVFTPTFSSVFITLCMLLLTKIRFKLLSLNFFCIKNTTLWLSRSTKPNLTKLLFNETKNNSYASPLIFARTFPTCLFLCIHLFGQNTVLNSYPFVLSDQDCHPTNLKTNVVVYDITI